tara:strand:+ start:971 stop:3097 length:2127 start_codon:yes stop_codon:yes gene_type:complete
VQRKSLQLKPIIVKTLFTLVFFFLSLIFAGIIIKYKTQEFQTVSKIKIDKRENDIFSTTDLPSNFGSQSFGNNIGTEAELLRSHLLIKKTLDLLNLNIQIKRIGLLKETTLYKNSPFYLKHEINNSLLYDSDFDLEIREGNLTLTNKNLKTNIAAKMNEWINIQGNRIMLVKNDTIIKKLKIILNGNYSFVIYSPEFLAERINQKLNVKAIDKDMSILRIAFKDEIPQRAADFNNTLSRVYIDDYILMESQNARNIIDFIDDELKKVAANLKTSADALEQFQEDNNIIDLIEQKKIAISQISKLEEELLNIKIDENTILKLEEYLDNGDYFTEKALQIGFTDLIVSNAFDNLKNLTQKKRDLILLYKEDSDEIKNINSNIEEIKFYINESIRSSKNIIKSKRKELEKIIDLSSGQFDNLPDTEGRFKRLEREFNLHQSIFNILTQKRIEKSIIASSTNSFNRIIQKAYVPTKPIQPNKILITFLCGFFGLIISLLIIFINEKINPRISSGADIEKNTLLPLSGFINKSKSGLNRDHEKLIQSLLLKEKLKPNQLIAVSSTKNKKNKNAVAIGLYTSLMDLGYKTCYVDYDLSSDSSNSYKSELNIDLLNIDKLESGSSIDFRDYQREFTKEPSLLKLKLGELKKQFDFVVINTAPIANHIEPLQIMKLAGISFFVFKINSSNLESLKNINLISEEFKLDNLHLLLSDV